MVILLIFFCKAVIFNCASAKDSIFMTLRISTKKREASITMKDINIFWWSTLFRIHRVQSVASAWMITVRTLIGNLFHMLSPLIVNLTYELTSGATLHTGNGIAIRHLVEWRVICEANMRDGQFYGEMFARETKRYQFTRLEKATLFWWGICNLLPGDKEERKFVKFFEGLHSGRHFRAAYEYAKNK